MGGGGGAGLALLWSKIKKLKIALSLASPEKEKYFLFIYDVITWEIFYKRAANHYLHMPRCQHSHASKANARRAVFV